VSRICAGVIFCSFSSFNASNASERKHRSATRDRLRSNCKDSCAQTLIAVAVTRQLRERHRYLSRGAISIARDAVNVSGSSVGPRLDLLGGTSNVPAGVGRACCADRAAPVFVQLGCVRYRVTLVDLLS
jgi:hypothetical protein